MSDRFGDLDEAADKAEKRADEKLADQLEKIRGLTSVDLEALKPKIEMQDEEKFEQLMAAVEESTRNNESLAEFRTRVTTLVKDGGAFVERVGGLAAKFRPRL